MFIKSFTYMLVFTCLVFAASGDTFINKTTGETLNGYITEYRSDKKIAVYIKNQGDRNLVAEDWVVLPNRLGRQNTVVIILIQGRLDLQIVCDALVETINKACQAGPAQVILEIDSPGGKTQYIERLCDVIIRTNFCPIAAYIKSGEHRGAAGGATAIALACDQIYMAGDTIIGASAIIRRDSSISQDSPLADYQNLSIAWQEYLFRIAEYRNRPGLIARAMVDQDIAVIEVIRNGKPVFIGPDEKEPNDLFIKNWSDKGSLLTLTAAEARKCRIAEAVVVDRTDLLQKLDLAEAQLIVKDDALEAARTFRKAQLKFASLRRRLDADIKRLELTDSLPHAMNLLREVKEQYKSLHLLARRYPDLYLDIELIEEQLTAAEDYYEKAKEKQRAQDSNSPRSHADKNQNFQK
ncbi:MAG: hypothetical protein WCZ89_02375 [Phycisphaerae bacterium]